MQSCLPVNMAGTPASLMATTCKPMPALIATSPVKDSRWLTLEVCREYARNKCPRSENECRYAHPPSDVEIQTGRVVCCFDSIKGRCQRTNPPCKYLHPPQHLKEQLLQNGRNNLIRRNLQLNAAACFLPTIYPMFSPLVIDNNNSYYTSPLVVNPTPINIQYAVSPNYPTNNNNINNSNVCNNAYLNNTINNNLNNNLNNNINNNINNNNVVPAIMPSNRSSNDDDINNNIHNNNINNNHHHPYEFCNPEQQIEKMAYTPSNSSPSLVASPDFSTTQAYWATPQPVIDPSTHDPLSAYYPPLILQVAGNISGPHGFYPALLKQTMDSINNNITTPSTTTPTSLPTTTTTGNNNTTNNTNNYTNGKSCSVSNTSTSNNNPVYLSNNNIITNNISSNNGYFTPIYPCGLQYGNPGLHTSPMTYPMPPQMQPQPPHITQPQHCYPISISGSMQANTIQRY